VQMGDTGELVAAAFNLHVPHPPGYPLIILLSYVFIKLFPLSTVFWRVALLTSLYSVAVAFIVVKKARYLPWVGISVALLLATTKIFWRYSLLPDVFALNSLFASIIVFLYLDTKSIRYQKWIPFVFFIGLTNHLSLIFLSPIVLHVLFKEYKSLKFWVVSFTGFLLMVGTYYLLFLFHPADFESWGDITTFNNLVHHFLRTDYGTFKLVAGEQKVSLATNLFYLVKQAFESFSVLIIVSLVCFLKRLKIRNFSSKEIIFTVSFLIYVFGFFSLSNMNISGPKIELISRFFILANLLFFFWALIQITKAKLKIKYYLMIGALFIFNSSYNVVSFYSANDFSKNTVIEDYAINFLSQAPKDKNAIMLAGSDTRFSAMKYVLNVLDTESKTVLIHPNFFFYSWYIDKTKKKNLKANYQKLFFENAMALEPDFVLLNVDTSNILTNIKFENAERLKITILQLGKMLTSGTGVYVAMGGNALKLRTTQRDIDSPKIDYDVFRELLTEYSAYYTTLGNTYLKNGDLKTASLNFTKALDLVPWDTLAKTGQCEVIRLSSGNAASCLIELELLKKEYFPYF
jgi:Protein of unknown function (DUF2723)